MTRETNAGGPAARISVEVRLAAFDPFAELAAFWDARRDMGALANFVGWCRDASERGVVKTLELEHYPGFTEREIARMAEEIALSRGAAALKVIHRAGAVEPGEAIVLVAAVARHRAEAFAATEALMDYLKTDAPFWKRETDARGARWIEPTAQDRARRAAQNILPGETS